MLRFTQLRNAKAMRLSEALPNNFPTTVEATMISPSSHNHRCLVGEPSQPEIVVLTNRIGIHLEELWIGRAQCKQVSDQQTRITQRSGKSNAATNSCIVERGVCG